ncbi:MAG: DivIVA domain-containing protein [Oscillospiraceae bacterium]|nr:DivIVA domain-containing protein [Oscillospiraceae bacterium]
MFTPQQIDQISFSKATFGGYNMDDVDQFLEPLTEDYVTLYKENALLKSKMRVLVGKLEEYRKNEASMKEAILNAQAMVRDAEANGTIEIVEAAPAIAAPVAPVANSDALIAAEEARVEEARKAAAAKIEEIQEQMRSCIQALDRIKQANAPAAPVEPKIEAAPAVEAPKVAFDYEAAAAKIDTDAVADEISQSLEALVGTTVDTAPKAEPRHPVNDTTTSKFANLQFGRNYDFGR